MDMRLLHGFIATAELGSMTLAAQKLNLTQSALSRQIKALEEHLGVDLFERSGKKLRLSPEGDALMTRMNDVLIANRNLKSHAEELRKGEAGVLRVGACSQLIERYFPAFLKLWTSENPTIDIRLEEGGGAELNAKLLAGTVQIALNASTYLQDDLEGVPLGELAVVALGVDAHLPAADGPIDVAQLCRSPLLILNRRHASREMFDTACRLSGCHPSIALESSSPHTLFSLAEGGVGIAVVPDGGRTPHPNLNQRPIALNGRTLAFDLSAMWRRAETLPAYGRRFVEGLRAHIAADPTASRENTLGDLVTAPTKVIALRRERA